MYVIFGEDYDTQRRGLLVLSHWRNHLFRLSHFKKKILMWIFSQMVNISTRCCWKMNVSRKCEENVLFPPSCGEDTWHVARVWVFAHSPNNCRECGGRYTGKYYSWRDYLESVLSILWWTLATTLCAPDWELWLPGNTQQIQHKNILQH